MRDCISALKQSVLLFEGIKVPSKEDLERSELERTTEEVRKLKFLSEFFDEKVTHGILDPDFKTYNLKENNSNMEFLKQTFK